MKKHFRKILSGLLGTAMLLSSAAVSAAPQTMQVNWRGDYSDSSNPKLIMDIETPAMYTQQIMTVIYDNDVTSPTYENYIRVKEDTVTRGEKLSLTFKIDSSFDADDNKYKLSVQGSGYKADTSKWSDTVTLLTTNDVRGLLARINAATESTIMGVMDDAAAPLQYTAETNDARRVKLAKILVAIRTDDYNGSFPTLEAVRKAWNAADVISALTDGITATALREKLETNAVPAGLDVTSADYTASVDELCRYLLDNAAGYKNGKGVNSIKDLQTIYGQYLGMLTINKSTDKTVLNVLETYKSYFDVENTVLEKYNNMGTNAKSPVAAYLFNQKTKRAYTSPSALATDFSWAVTNTSSGSQGGNNDNNNNNNNNNDNKGNDTSFSGGIGGPAAPSQPTGGGYRDVAQSHWAYSYINTLSQKGIISGYDDNTFKPENNVTREEFVKMIIAASGLYNAEAECEFTDVPKNAWYYRYVASAVESGIISGTDDGSFGAGANITRQDVAVIAARILEHFGKSVKAETTSLTDIESVSDYAQSSVKMLSAMGIINGFDDGSFMPHNALTRAEAATIISKLINSL